MPKSHSPVEIVATPRGPETGAMAIGGFQYYPIEKFQANENIPKSTKETPHKLNFDVVMLITSGKGFHYVDFKPYAYKEGDILIIKNGQFHSWRISPKTKGHMLFFLPEFHNAKGANMKSNLIDLGSSPIHPPLITDIPKEEFSTLGKLSELIALDETKKLAENKFLVSLIESFLIKLEAIYTNQVKVFNSTRRWSTFQSFQDLLATTRPLSRNGNFYCSELGISYRELNQLCVEVSGNTLKQYIDFVILIKSKRLLSDLSTNISEIAFDLGFKEVGNFSKYFKKHSGQTPKEFRRSANFLLE